MASQFGFWNGPAFLAGRRMRATNVFMGQQYGTEKQGVTWPEDYHFQIQDYEAKINSLPEQTAAPLRAQLESCKVFLNPGVFSPLRIEGCLNSIMLQLRAMGIQA